MSSIPKIAHIAWKTKDVIHSQSPIILNGLKNLIDLNPDWTVTIYDDNDVDEYLRGVLNKRDYNLIKDIHIVEKTDLWRLFKLYNEGGLYMDIDRFYNIPLSNIITDGIKCVLPTCLDWDFSQDFMLTEPKNPIQAKTIELILERRYAGHKNVFFLGPQTYMHAVTSVLFGEIINTNPGVEKFTEMRKHLEQITFIKTYREHPPHDTIVYKGNGDMDWEKLKKEFYAEANIKHWSGEW
jgi:mannosyltransferase OCH1-like enzyme